MTDDKTETEVELLRPVELEPVGTVEWNRYALPFSSFARTYAIDGPANAKAAICQLFHDRDNRYRYGCHVFKRDGSRWHVSIYNTVDYPSDIADVSLDVLWVK